LTHPRIEYLSSAGEQVTQNTVLCHGGQHGLEPTLNATVQRVVVQRLKVGLVGFTLPKLPRRAAEDGMPSPPIAPEISHMCVDPKVIPAASEGLPTWREGVD